MRTQPVPGSDPTPSQGERAPDDPPSSADANDARLQADKPPHWA